MHFIKNLQEQKLHFESFSNSHSYSKLPNATISESSLKTGNSACELYLVLISNVFPVRVGNGELFLTVHS